MIRIIAMLLAQLWGEQKERPMRSVMFYNGDDLGFLTDDECIVVTIEIKPASVMEQYYDAEGGPMKFDTYR